MSAVLTLKRFDHFKGGLGLKDPSRDLTSIGQPGAIDAPREDGAELEPVPVQPSPEQLKTEALQRELAATQAQLAAIVESLSNEMQSAKRSANIQCVEAIAEAATALLPTLLDRSFAEELSAATLRITAAIEPEDVTLKVHADDHEPVVKALKTLAPPRPVVVEEDSTLAPGMARLSWPNGGARFDKAALLKDAADLLDARLASILSGKDRDDH